MLLSGHLSRFNNDKDKSAEEKSELWCTCFITKTEVLFFLVCAKDRDFWERIFSLNSHVSLFYIHVVVVVVIYSGKDSYPKDTRKKKEDGKPKIWLADLAC